MNFVPIGSITTTSAKGKFRILPHYGQHTASSVLLVLPPKMSLNGLDDGIRSVKLVTPVYAELYCIRYATLWVGVVDIAPTSNFGKEIVLSSSKRIGHCGVQHSTGGLHEHTILTAINNHTVQGDWGAVTHEVGTQAFDYFRNNWGFLQYHKARNTYR